MKRSWLANYNLLLFDQLDSTNSEALRLAASGVTGNFIIMTDEQKLGRGQRGKAWCSLPGNLHFSILLNNSGHKKRSSQISFVAANALYKSVEFFATKQNIDLEISLKWPNDVLINGQKFAGLLLESITLANITYVVIGIGVNIVANPENIEYPVTNLLKENIKLKGSDEFFNIFMNKFEESMKLWKTENNFISTRKYWLKHAHNLNKKIRINDGEKITSGIFREIDFDGSLRVEMQDGKMVNFSAGEVSYYE